MPKSEDKRVLSAPVTQVMVMEDRARVRRVGTISVEPGRHLLMVSDVAPVLADKTLLVSATQVGDGEAEATFVVVNSKVRREVVSESVEREGVASTRVALVEEHKAVLRQIAELDARGMACQHRSVGLARARRQSLSDLAEDASFGKVVGPEWQSKLDALTAHSMESLDNYAVLLDSRDELREKAVRLQARLSQEQSPRDRKLAWIEIEIECKETSNIRVQLEYSVPGACWRPYHQAQLRESSTENVVTLKTDACVWQNTGEDWNDIELMLSTERASLGVSPPILASDTLHVSAKSNSVDIESREEHIDTVTTSSGEVPGIDDGGVVVHLRAPEKCTLPSDGRPHRIFLQSTEMDASLHWVAIAEINPCVLLTTELENTGGRALLAGPVDLIRDSGLVGRSKILYVASGAKFEMGWGPEPDIRLRRVTEVSSEKSKLLSSWSEKRHSTQVLLSNLGQTRFSISVKERVPVSEIDKVKIEVNPKKTTNGQSADENGFVVWTLDLAPQGQQRIDLEYSVKLHDEVLRS